VDQHHHQNLLAVSSSTSPQAPTLHPNLHAPDECVDLLGLDVVHALHGRLDLTLARAHVHDEHLVGGRMGVGGGGGLRGTASNLSTQTCCTRLLLLLLLPCSALTRCSVRCSKLAPFSQFHPSAPPLLLQATLPVTLHAPTAHQPHQGVVVLNLLHGGLGGEGGLEDCVVVQLLQTRGAVGLGGEVGWMGLRVETGCAASTAECPGAVLMACMEHT